MKNQDKLMVQLASPENLLEAWRSVRGNIPVYRRQRSSGPDGVTLAEFERDLPAQLNALRHMLLLGRYQPQPPGLFSLQKRNGGTRQIAVLNVSDRVAQRATQQVIEPIYEAGYLPCNFGFRPGRSTLDAIVCARRLRNNGYRWVVDADIESCFDSLDHRLLMKKMEQRIRDNQVLELLHKWLDAGVLEHGMPPGVASSDQSGWLAQEWEKTTINLRNGVNWALNAFADKQPDPYSEPRYYSPYATYDRPSYTSLDPEAIDMQEVNGMGRRENVEKEDEDYYRSADQERRDAHALQQRAVQQIATSGLLLGTSWARRSLVSASKAAITALQSPAGRAILKKGLLAGGGAVGAATGVAISAYLLYRNVAPNQVGVLQGSPLSPLLANIYLHSFDVSLTRAGFRLVRFADDWVILCPDQNAAEKAYNESISALVQIRLKVNAEKTHILSPTDRLEWLGYAVD